MLTDEDDRGKIVTLPGLVGPKVSLKASLVAFTSLRRALQTSFQIPEMHLGGRRIGDMEIDNTAV